MVSLVFDVAAAGALFPGKSEMAERMRLFDWSGNQLGPPDKWPEALKTSVRIVLTSRHAMFVWWGEQLINLYNDAYAAFLCAKHPHALGRPAATVWPEIWHQVGPRVELAMRRDEGTYDEALPFVMHRKGYPEETYVTFSYSPIRDEAGGFGGILCPVTEDTQRIQGERQMALLRELASKTADARSTREACELAASALRTDSDDLPFALLYLVDVGMEVASLAASCGTHENAPAALETVRLDGDSFWPLREVITTNRARVVSDLTHGSHRLPLARGQYAVQQAITMPIAPSGANSPLGVLIIGLNPLRLLDDNYRQFLDLVASGISAAFVHADAYEAERRRAEALAELDRTKTAFFSNVSHEFRTPLTLLLGPLDDMLARATDSLTVTREELEFVHRNSLRLLKLVNTLLDFSRLEAGRMKASLAPVDLPQLTAEVASVFRAAIEKAGLHLAVECPPLGEPVYVDRSMWEKIVLNLVSNAFKFTFDGEIKVAVTSCGEYAELAVSDTGIGIAGEQLPRIFERFHRIEGARARTFEGSGIGLALVQELAKLHGGSVRVHSEPGVGSKFVVSMPLGDGHLSASAAGPKKASIDVSARAYVEEAMRWQPDSSVQAIATEEPAHATAESRAARPRILLADDNADLRQYVQHLLQGSYDVTSVGDGEMALAAMREHPPDLVLTDVMMPRLDGFGLLKALRSDPTTRNIPAILLSAHAGEDVRVEGLASGATDYLVKPFSARELLARISTSLEVTLDNRATLNHERQLRTIAEHAEIATKAELVAELAAMKGLHEFATRLLSKTEFKALLEELLDAAIALQRADFGLAQLYDPDTRALEIVVQRGFNAEFLDHFRSVRADDTACARAMQSRERIVIEDVETDPGFALHRAVAASAGFRAAQSTPLFGRGGQVLGVLSTHFRRPHRPSERELRFTDLYARLGAELIERHQAEDALRASEERFRRYFDLGLIGMAITSPTKGCLEVNDELCRILGYEREELLKKTWAEMTHADDLAADVAQFERVIAGDIDGYSLDKRWVRKDGRVIDSIMAAKCMRRGDGSVDYLVGLVLDTTERKRAEDALRLSQAQLVQAQRLSQTGSWTLNLATATLCWSEEHLRILGLDPQAKIPEYPDALEVVHPDDRAEVNDALETAICNRSTFEAGCRIVRPDGSVRDIHTLAEPVLDEAGRVIELIGTIIDVTERKRAEQAVLRLQHELAHANRVAALGELSASIAHEVNQPLAAIVTNGEACLRLLSRKAETAKIREAVDCIVADAVRASEVIKHMRTLVHNNNGAYALIDVNDIIREVIALVAGQLARNAVLFRTELADGTPRVFGDRVQLQQVVLNLILNANDAIKKHSVMRREIFVCSGRSGINQFIVEVHDTGCGLDPGNLHRLFEAFFTTRSDDGGLGLGLSISRSIVEAHGGKIWAKPNEAGGATFSFTLPEA